MHGTSWTGPGQGATIVELWRETLRADVPTNMQLDAAGALNRLRAPITTQEGWSRRTNLTLTGQPLTAYDVKRIAEAR